MSRSAGFALALLLLGPAACAAVADDAAPTLEAVPARAEALRFRALEREGLCVVRLTRGARTVELATALRAPCDAARNEDGTLYTSFDMFWVCGALDPAHHDRSADLEVGSESQGFVARDGKHFATPKLEGRCDTARLPDRVYSMASSARGPFSDKPLVAIDAREVSDAAAPDASTAD